MGGRDVRGGAGGGGGRAERRAAAPFGFLFSGTPAEGIEVRLTVAPRDGAVVLHVADVTDDLTVVPGYTAPENRAVVTPAVAVTRTVRL
ncbi:hypothetical protein ACYAFX_06865 [Rhodococcus aetherivorans]